MNATKLTTTIGRTMRMATRSITTSQSRELQYKLEDCKDQNVFRIELAPKTYAYIEYDKNNTRYDLNHTKVPEEFEGQGIGKLLAKKTFDHLKAEGSKFALHCDFLVHFYNQNEDLYVNNVVS